MTRELSFPVEVSLDGPVLTVTGMVKLKQTHFGIKPVRAAGGTVRVKDQVRVSFRIVATASSP